MIYDGSRPQPQLTTPDGSINVEWLSEQLGACVTAVCPLFHDKLGGLSGSFCFVAATLTNGKVLKLALKTVPANHLERSAKLGNAREALFYKELGASLEDTVPHVYYAQGDMESGESVVLMECLEGSLPCGVLYGPGNPNNWSIKDNLLAMSAGRPSAEQASADAFKLYARLHGSYWNDTSLFAKSWLRGAAWFQGQGESTWRDAMQMASDAWQQLSDARAEGRSNIAWDEHLVACLQASFGKVSEGKGWVAQQEELATRPFTLVHGDCHPHNVLLVEPCHTRRVQAGSDDGQADHPRLCLVDFEMVGIGSGAQELGQFLISHMEVACRRACERRLVQAYHAELVATLRARGLHEAADRYGIDECWAEYVAGGAGRWAWFVAYLGCKMPALAQFFHDQLAAFLHDHVPDPANVPMPRV